MSMDAKKSGEELVPAIFRSRPHSHDFVPGAWVDVVGGDVIVCEIVIDLSSERIDEDAWLFCLAVERVAALLDKYDFCPFRSFLLKFRAAAELVAERPDGKRKRDALSEDIPF